MNKNQYLNKLYNNLRWQVSPYQAEDILADYDEYFNAGIAEGKNEQQLCNEFGSAQQIVDSILGEQSLFIKRCLPYAKKILVILLCTSLPVMNYTLCLNFSFGGYLAISCCIPLLLLILTGDIGLFQRKGDSNNIIMPFLSASGAIISLIISVVTITLVKQTLNEVLPPSINAITQYHRAILNSPGIVGIFISLLWVATILGGRGKRVSNCESTIYFVYAGCVSAMCLYQHILSLINFRESDVIINRFVRSIYLQTLSLIALGFVLCVFCLILRNIKFKAR